MGPRPAGPWPPPYSSSLSWPQPFTGGGGDCCAGGGGASPRYDRILVTAPTQPRRKSICCHPPTLPSSIYPLSSPLSKETSTVPSFISSPRLRLTSEGEITPKVLRGPRSSSGAATQAAADATDLAAVFVELRGMRVAVLAVGCTEDDGVSGGHLAAIASRAMPRELQKTASADSESAGGTGLAGDFIAGTPRHSVVSGQRRISKPSMLLKSPSRSTLQAVAAGGAGGGLSTTSSRDAFGWTGPSVPDGARAQLVRCGSNGPDGAATDPLERWLGLDVARPLLWAQTNLVELCDLRHPHIVSTFGGSLLYGRQVLVEECLELGSLLDVLADAVRAQQYGLCEE